MKRTLLIVAIATALVFAFGTVALAKYAGYAYNNPVVALDGSIVPNEEPGYISWTGAQALMTLNGVDPALQTSPHGGYTVNTTKCAVCHSTHRAATDATAAGIGSYWKLTPGGTSCLSCHTPHGANPVPTALIEWPAVYSDGGPHARQNCMGACHAGIHGAGGSQYGTMNRFLLTGANDPAIAAALAAGNTYTAAESDANDAASGGGRGVVTAETFMDYGATITGTEQRTTQTALRAMATGYTCGAAGCHSSSQFAVNKEGYAELRASDPRASSTLDTLFTGHLTNMTYGCPPCHMNDTAFYTWNLEDLGRDSQCALCHDMIGKATGSSAFPHANRNITVFEFPGTADANGLITEEKVVSSMNLWMYVGDASRRDADGNAVPNGTPGSTTNTRARRVLEAVDHKYNIQDGMCLKCHAYVGGQHTGTGYGSTYNKKDGTPTGNILDFSHF